MDTQKLLNAPPKKVRVVARISKVNNLVEASSKIKKSTSKLRKIFERGTYQKKIQLSVLNRYKKRLDSINKESDKKLEKSKKRKGRSFAPKIKPFVGTFFKPSNDPLKSLAQLAAFKAASRLAKGDVFGAVGPGLALASLIFGPKLLKIGGVRFLKTLGIGRGYEDLIKKLSRSKTLTEGERVAVKNFERYKKAGLTAEEAAQRALGRGGGYSIETAREFRKLERGGAGGEIRATIAEERVARASERVSARGATEGGEGLLKSVKGLRAGVGILDAVFAAFDYKSRREEGQTRLQAGTGAFAGAAGGIAGWQVGAAIGASLGAGVLGIGAVPGAVIGGIIGSIAGSSLFGGLSDMITGANKQPTGGMKTSFNRSLDYYEKVINKFSLLSFTSPTTTLPITTQQTPGTTPTQSADLVPTTNATNFTRGQLTSFFGSKESFRKKAHEGIDIGTNQGTPISFKLGGQVIASHRTSSTEKEANGGYGSYIDVKLDNGTIIRMAHLSSISSWANAGAKFSPGEIIALSGGEPGYPGSGRSSGPHIHLEQHQSAGLGEEETLRGKVDPVKNGAFGLVQRGGVSRQNTRRSGSATMSALNSPQTRGLFIQDRQRPSRAPSISQYTSYAPSAYTGGVAPLPVPAQQQMQRPIEYGDGEGVIVLTGPSEQELLNSFYKRVLLNTV